MLRIFSDQRAEFVNQDFEKHARQRGIHLATAPAHQPQSNGVAERLVGLAKQCTRRLLLASSLPDIYWSHAFGEEVGIWRSHYKKQAKSAHNKGAVGRLIAIDPCNGCILIAKGADVQDPELVSGLQPKTVAVDCLRLSKPRIVPDGWSEDAIQNLAVRWQLFQTPKGKDLWLRMGYRPDTVLRTFCVRNEECSCKRC